MSGSASGAAQSPTSRTPPLACPNAWEVVLEAVRQNGAMLQHASPELQEDPLVVLEAVRQNSSAFLYAAPSLQKDKDIVLAAVKQDGLSLRKASAELQARQCLIGEVQATCCKLATDRTQF